MSFDAHEDKVMEMFNRKVYNIPRNQRKYVWTKTNWQELFDDIMAVVDGKIQSHFIGSIVLEEKPMKNGLPQFLIIDGQQRAITLTIFLTSIMYWMKKLDLKDDFNGTLPYVVAKDDKNQNVIMVTADNNGSLESIIRAVVFGDDDSIKKASVTSIIEGNLSNISDKNIGNAFKFFINEISDKYETIGNGQEFLIKLRNAVREITFVNITATTEEDSYTIFEILNARGLDLEDHELLKNYIMRFIRPDADRDKAKATWQNIEAMLGYSNLRDFTRHYTNHRYGDYRRKSDTSDYKIIQSRNRGNDTWNLLTDLERKAGYYSKLIAPARSKEENNCSDVEYRVYEFFRKKRQKQLRPVLLSLIAKNKEGVLPDATYERTIEFLYNFYVCYHIIGEESSNRLTDAINKYAAKINLKCSDELLHQFEEELINKLPTEKMFINSFKNVGWSHHDNIYNGKNNKERVRAVLEILERYKNFGKCDDQFTIEHIYPDSESTEFGQIGNLLPLEKELNERCRNKMVEEKITIYEESSYRTTRNFSKYYRDKEFIPEKRTEYMAREFYNDILKFSE